MMKSMASSFTVNFAHVLTIILIYIKQPKNNPGYEINVSYHVPFTVNAT